MSLTSPCVKATFEHAGAIGCCAFSKELIGYEGPDGHDWADHADKRFCAWLACYLASTMSIAALVNTTRAYSHVHDTKVTRLTLTVYLCESRTKIDHIRQ